MCFGHPSGYFELLGLHVNFTQLGETATQLEECLNAFQDAHVGESDFLDELEFRMFRQCGDGFGHSEHGADDVV